MANGMGRWGVARAWGLVSAAALGAVLGGCVAEVEEAPGQRALALENGVPATPEQLGATVALVRPTQLHCTGTLVAPRVVVTASHCVWESDVQPELEIAVGAVDIAQAVRVGIDAIHLYPGWDITTTECIEGVDPDGLCDWHDVAVLILSTPVTEQEPAPILEVAAEPTYLQTGSTFTLAGYGYTSETDYTGGVLHHGPVSFQREQGVEMVLGTVGEARLCNKDSGAPAYIAGHLAGVISRESAAGIAGGCGDIGVYTIASRVAPWIRETAGAAWEGAPEPSTPTPDEPADDEGCALHPASDSQPPYPLILLALLGVLLRARRRG